MEKASPRGEAFAAVWLRMNGSVTVEEIEQGFLDGPLKDAGKRGGLWPPKKQNRGVVANQCAHWCGNPVDLHGDRIGVMLLFWIVRCGGDAAPYSAVLLSTNARFRSTGPSTPESIPSFAYCHTSK